MMAVVFVTALVLAGCGSEPKSRQVDPKTCAKPFEQLADTQAIDCIAARLKEPYRPDPEAEIKAKQRAKQRLSADPAITRVFEVRGRLTGFVEKIDGTWYPGDSHECDVEPSGRTYTAYIGHTAIGAAVRISARSYNVWAAPASDEWPSLPASRGHRLRGRIVRHNAKRWDIYSNGSQFLGYTIGKGGPDAGAAKLLFGRLLTDCD